MSNEKFYNLEKENFKLIEKARADAIKARKQPFLKVSRNVGTKSLISREKVMIMIMLFVLVCFLFPIVKGYIVRSKITAEIKSIDVLRRDIVDAIMFQNPLQDSDVDNLPKNVSVDYQRYEIRINIGSTGSKILDGKKYVMLKPYKAGQTINWKCKIEGKDIDESYIPDNCQ